MTVENYRYVGYIRTNVLSKALGMFDPERIVELCATRGMFRDTIDEDEGRGGFVKIKRKVHESINVDWNRDKHGGTFPVFPANKMPALIKLYGLGDMVVQKVSYMFTDSRLASRFNNLIAERAKEKGRKNPILLAENIVFYATFTNNHSADLQALQYLSKMNQHEIDNYGFKIGCLDLTKLNTERAIKYGEKERIDVEDDAQLVRLVLQSLEWDGWQPDKRNVVINEMTVTPNPVAIRQYKLCGTKGWVLMTEKELNGKWQERA